MIYTDPIAEKERIKYEKVWTTIEAYSQSSPGLDLADKAIELMREYGCGSVLDAGCGCGKALNALVEEGLLVSGVDITFTGIYNPSLKSLCEKAPLWDLPESIAGIKIFNTIYCIDVMEHIPEEKIDQVVDNLADRCNKIAIFQIAMFQDRFGEMIGERLHLTIKPKEWWERKILRRFKNIKEIENVRGRFTFVCEVI